jgi:hypothetical protein
VNGPSDDELNQAKTKYKSQSAQATTEGTSEEAGQSGDGEADRSAIVSRSAVTLWQDRIVVEDCSDDEAEAPLTRVTVEPITVMPDDSDTEEVCCVHESLGDSSSEDNESAEDARFLLEHVCELCENFEHKLGKFLTGMRSPPTEVECDEEVDDFPTRFFTNNTEAGGSRQAKIDTGAFAIWVSAAVHREIGTEPLACGGDANEADGRALSVLGSGRIVFGL